MLYKPTERLHFGNEPFGFIFNVSDSVFAYGVMFLTQSLCTSVIFHCFHCVKYFTVTHSPRQSVRQKPILFITFPPAFSLNNVNIHESQGFPDNYTSLQSCGLYIKW